MNVEEQLREDRQKLALRRLNQAHEIARAVGQEDARKGLPCGSPFHTPILTDAYLKGYFEIAKESQTS